MKNKIVYLFLFISFLLPQYINSETCECTAPDGSCSVSIACADGCAAGCGTRGRCSAKCCVSGFAMLQKLNSEMNLNVKDMLLSDIVDLIATQQEIKITVPEPFKNYRASFDIKGMKIYQILREIERMEPTGTRLQISGIDEISLGFTFDMDEPVSVCFKDISGIFIAEYFSLLTDKNIVFAGDLSAKINYKAENASIREILGTLSKNQDLKFQVE